MRQPSQMIREEFQIEENNFTLPESTLGLDSKTKRALTICNLFINHKLAIADISRLLDEDTGRVVQALLERRIIHDRRRTFGRAPAGIERRRSKTEKGL
jgi:hypothetical protein